MLTGKIPEIAYTLLCYGGHSLFQAVVAATDLFVLHFHVTVNHYFAEGFLEEREERGTRQLTILVH